MGNANWNNGSTWTSVGMTNSGTVQSQTSVSPTAVTVSFNITAAAKTWVGYSNDANSWINAGIMLRCSNTTNKNYCRSFYTENSGPATAPYIVVDYTPLIEDGTYYIRNEETKKLLDIENNQCSEGTAVEQQDFHADASVIWRVTLKSNGYYSIQTTIGQETNTYMGVSNVAYTASVSYAVTLYSSGTRKGSQWAIIPIIRGLKTSYKIVSLPWGDYHDNTEQVLALPSSATDGTNVVQKAYTNDGDYRDEWTLHRAMPTSGAEIAYEPERWSDTNVLVHTNCYSYMLNRQVDPSTGDGWEINPGQAGIDSASIVDITTLVDAIEDDSDALGFEFVAIGAFDPCPARKYKVALVCYISEDNVNYHWYRQNPDGTWSHKQGGDMPSNKDYSNDLILDSQTADIRYKEDGKYEFVGYYSVKPLTSYYAGQ